MIKDKIDVEVKKLLEIGTKKGSLNEEDINDLILLNDSKIVNEDISIDKTNTEVNGICIDNYIYIDMYFVKQQNQMNQ